MKKHLMFLSAAILTILSLSIFSSAHAGSTLHIGFGAGTDCATGCGGHPNLSPTGGSDTFNIYQNSGGATDISSPVWLIIGVPDVSSPTFFSTTDITRVTYYTNYSKTYPGGASAVNNWTYQGWQGNLTASNEVYGDVLGLTPPSYNLNNSNNFTNWHDYDLAINGIDASYFGIYVFHLYTGLAAHDLIDIQFASNSTLPKGSYVLAYGSGSDYGVPFTESGLQVPEPSTLIMLGAGLLALGLIRRRFLRESA